MTVRLKLGREWVLGERIGQGGFGQVFAATSSDGTSAVVKLVPKTPGANRELLFVELNGIRNVIPIIDKGEADDNLAIVMPRAKMSLRQHIDELGVPPSVADAATILLDIALALVDLDGKIVHRDLKPENILWLNGHWCLADFGISRYAEASTAPDTQKYALSPAYAAPERWRQERATIATDVYSLGVIAFELLTQRRPFPGPDLGSYRDQHLHNDPPTLTGAPTGLRAIVTECLYKAPDARPGPANLCERLKRIGRGPLSGGLARLSEANLAEVARRSESERLASEARSAAERRAALFRSAAEGGKMIGDALIEAIADAAPAATRESGKRRGVSLNLGQAQIEFVPILETPPDPWERLRPVFDVVAHGGVIIRFPEQNGYAGRSHSLWFCDAHEATRYQWFETAFMISPLLNRTSVMRPFALDPGPEAAVALSNVVGEFQPAWPFQSLDIGDLDELIDRWANWFAKAAEGRLTPPSMIPERPTPRSWRQR